MVLEEKLLDKAFDKHTYKHTTMGFEADVKAMPKGYDYSLTFFKRFYRPENVVILITGDVQPKAAFGLIEKYYGELEKKATSRRRSRPSRREQQAERSGEISYPGKTLPILCLAYKGGGLRSRRQRLCGRAIVQRIGLRRDPANCKRNSCSAIRRSKCSWPTCR